MQKVYSSTEEKEVTDIVNDYLNRFTDLKQLILDTAN